MALIKCPACGKELSETAVTCVNCGHRLKTISSRIKKFLVLLVITLLVIGFVGYQIVNNAELSTIKNESANAKSLLNDTMTIIANAGNNATDACSIILDVWANARSRDFNGVFRYMFSGDIKNHQSSGLGMDKQGFSPVSWDNLAEEMNSFKGRLNALETEKIEVDKKLEQIKLIKREGFEKELDAIINYYNSYLKLYNAATNPSGNQLNYSANLVTMKSEFNSNKVKAEMLIKQ